jgi:ribosomal protein S18 acetylase RimI-like enzyme
VHIRPLSANDAALLRDLRLRALLDSPDSFGPTHEQSLAEPPEFWEGWASGGDGRFQVLVAFGAEGLAVGLISCSFREPGVGGCGALWVAPETRGTGLGRALMEAAIDLLEGRGCERILLSVTDGNPAERLYESLGFKRTGERHPMREGSPLFEVKMARTKRGSG